MAKKNGFSMRKVLFLLCAAMSLEAAPFYFIAKAGYFRFSDQTMRDVYKNQNYAVLGEAGFFLGSRHLALFASGSYTRPTGAALEGGESTSIELGTLTLGPKFIVYPASWLGLYAGAGPRCFFYHEKDHSPFVAQSIHRSGIGGGFMGGILLGKERHGFLVDLFVDYSVKTFDKRPNGIASEVFDISLDSLTAGGGIGCVF